MKSLTIKPKSKDEFEEAFSKMKDFGKERNEIKWEDEDLSFVILKNVEDMTTHFTKSKTPAKTLSKK